jgi:hypothetical protein
MMGFSVQQGVATIFCFPSENLASIVLKLNWLAELREARIIKSKRGNTLKMYQSLSFARQAT